MIKASLAYAMCLADYLHWNSFFGVDDMLQAIHIYDVHSSTTNYAVQDDTIVVAKGQTIILLQLIMVASFNFIAESSTCFSLIFLDSLL